MNVQVGQEVDETVNVREQRILVNAGLPLMEVEVQRHVVYRDGEPIYRTVLPVGMSCRSQQNPGAPPTIYPVVPIKTERDNSLTQRAAVHRDESQTTLTRESDTGAVGMAFREGLTDAEAAAAAALGQSISQMHHADLSHYYDTGNLNESSIGWGYDQDFTDLGQRIVEREYDIDSRQEDVAAHHEVVPLANPDEGFLGRNALNPPRDEDRQGESSLNEHIPQQIVTDFGAVDRGINRYEGDEAVVNDEVVLNIPGPTPARRPGPIQNNWLNTEVVPGRVLRAISAEVDRDTSTVGSQANPFAGQANWTQ